MDFWVISFTPQSISQRLKPVYNTVRLLSQGSTLESKDATLPPPPHLNFCDSHDQERHVPDHATHGPIWNPVF